MSWNNGLERKKFENRQKKQADKYRKLGMTEEQIHEMYFFDLKQFRSGRCFYEHSQEFTTSDFENSEDDDSESTLYDKFFDQLSVMIDDSSDHSRYWWVEEIDGLELAKKLKTLSVDDIELLTKYVYDGYSQAEIAAMYGISQKNICKKLNRIKNYLKTGV